MTNEHENESARENREGSAAIEPTEFFSDGNAILEWVRGLISKGTSSSLTPEQVANFLWMVRNACKRTGLDPTQHGLLVQMLRGAFGLTVKQLGLPPPVDVVERAARNQRLRAFEEGDAQDLLDPDDTKNTAERLLESTMDHAGNPRIVRYAGEFFTADDEAGCYRPTSDEEIAAQGYAFLDGKRDVTTDRPIKPDRALVEGILHALRAVALINVPAVPAWIGNSANRSPAHRIVPFKNGLLDLDSRQLLKKTRAFFGLNSRDFAYQVGAKPPLRFTTFLNQIFEGDAECIETLQEIFGLLLTTETSFQKAFLIVGPPRSGKGTILRVLQRLLGAGNVCAPTLAGLGGPFGMQGMIGKVAALISDARLSSRADVQTIGETILRITGEDAVSIPRKFKDDWTTKLSVRFVIVSNELPALLDQSGALSSRFVILQLRNSFLGKEDASLTDRLLGEMAGIANWALEGLDRLEARGYFRQPAASAEAVRQLEMLASPIKAFLSERCAVEPGASVSCADLYATWEAWARTQGREHPGTIAIFGRNLAAAVPAVKVVLRRHDGTRSRFYEGIRLRTDVDPVDLGGSRSVPF